MWKIFNTDIIHYIYSRKNSVFIRVKYLSIIYTLYLIIIKYTYTIIFLKIIIINKEKWTILNSNAILLTISND